MPCWKENLVQHNASMRYILDAMLKCKDRINFYPCVVVLVSDTSDFAYHKFIAEIVFRIFLQALDTYQCSCLCPYCILSFYV